MGARFIVNSNGSTTNESSFYIYYFIITPWPEPWALSSFIFLITEKMWERDADTVLRELERLHH